LTFKVSATQTIASENAAGYSYRINFGDGSPVLVISRSAGNGSGVTFTHVFATAAVFTVTATATDVDGTVSNKVSDTLTVQTPVAAKVVLTLVQGGRVNTFLPSFQVRVQDEFGNAFNGVVSLVLVPLSGNIGAGFTAGSVTKLTTVNGVATFSQVAINQVGQFQLMFLIGGVSAKSNQFSSTPK
jgi:hypothetical protein